MCPRTIRAMGRLNARASGPCASAELPGIYEKFPGYRDATQFSGIFPEISGWLVGTYESFAG